MKRVGEAIAWLLSRLVKVFGNILSLLVRPFVPVRKGRVMCWAYNFKQYGCNPRYLSEYLLDSGEEYEIFWVYRKEKYGSRMDIRMKSVKFRSWRYFLLVNSAEYLITNLRTDPYHIYWHKRPGQKYLMLWHGGVALKKIEKDAQKQIGLSYLIKARLDSRVCDLMISGCKAQTKLLEEKFWYKGEILERGIPRNDIFFDTETHKHLRRGLCERYSIPADNRIVMYAPTFRRNHSIEPYSIDWSEVVPHLQRLYGGAGVTVLLRLHPNLIGKVDTTPLLNAKEVIDVTLYPDMQELLCVVDMLITDYSSSMFDYSMGLKPCLLYATDVEQYDRGYYYKFDELPFPLARNQQELIEIIDSFDEEKYKVSTQKFFDEKGGLVEDGNATKHIAEWMREHRIK